MKQKDLALIVVIVFVSAIVSLFASKAIFGGSNPASKQSEVVAPISTDFPQPDKKYFNEQSIDPTKTITIKQNSTTDPFSATSDSQ